MLISPELNAAINEEIGRELESSHIYLNMAGYVDGLALKKLAELLKEQSAEERDHALKFIEYVMKVGGKLEIPAIPAPKADFHSVEEAFQLALDWELDITQRIHNLVTLAMQQSDYAAQAFLQWFVTEQVEEVSKMETMMKVVKQAGQRNLIMIEAYLSHL
jgi:ferritin